MNVKKILYKYFEYERLASITLMVMRFLQNTYDSYETTETLSPNFRFCKERDVTPTNVGTTGATSLTSPPPLEARSFSRWCVTRCSNSSPESDSSAISLLLSGCRRRRVTSFSPSSCRSRTGSTTAPPRGRFAPKTTWLLTSVSSTASKFDFL